ncbi:MAG: hypothetical protein NTW38_12030 [Candidatus Aminicenantes bacterium]|nr:hypothetical protein [Candidatus Aminicenantes bacterium]
MKRIVLVTVLALAVLAGTAAAGTKEFWKGGIYVTPQIGFSSWGGSLPLGVSGEYGVTENIGVGGSVMGQFWSEEFWKVSLITIAAEANYHFTKLDADKVDLYAGAGLGYSVVSVSYNTGYSSGSAAASGLSLYPLVGGRYWFSPKIAASLKLYGYLVGSYTGFGGAIGVTFVLSK